MQSRTYTVNKMWKIWKKEKEERVNKIQVKGKDIFEFDLDEKWDITQVNFNYTIGGKVSQIILFIDNIGE